MNRVMLPRLDGPPSVVEARVDAIGAKFGGLPFSWWLDPGTRPEELLAILRRLEPDATIATIPAMALPLAGDPRPPAAGGPSREGRRSRAELEVVTTPEGLAAAESLAAAGFGAPAELAISIGSLFAGLHPAVAGQVLAVVASLDGAPASTGLACLAGDVAGIYNVATLPAARGLGLGAAVMTALIEAVRAREARLVVLESTEDGRPLYERLGFRIAGDLQVVSIDEPPA
jgi:ribosomal protein S18 acetylase RimI-like enzyme